MLTMKSLLDSITSHFPAREARRKIPHPLTPQGRICERKLNHRVRLPGAMRGHAVLIYVKCRLMNQPPIFRRYASGFSGVGVTPLDAQMAGVWQGRVVGVPPFW